MNWKRLILVASTALLGVTVAQAAFWDSYLANGAVRTEYPSNYGVGSNITLWYMPSTFGTTYGCLWQHTDPLASFFRCPGRRADASVWQGNLQERSACGGNSAAIGDSWQGCLQYTQNTYFSLNSPGSNYWVIHANNDPSFDQCRKGPPGASEAIIDPIAQPTTPNLYKVAMENNAAGRKTLNIIVAPWEHDFSCAGYFSPQFGSNKQYTIPYLSVGAHSNKGNGQDIGTVYPFGGTGSDILHFSAQIRGYGNIGGYAVGCAGGFGDPCPPVGAHAGVLLVAQWGGVRRMLFVDLYEEQALVGSYGHSHWSWPVYDSMFYPGGDVAAMNLSTLNNSCGLPTTGLTLGSPGAKVSYALSMSALFYCASNLGLFSSSMPFQYTSVEAVDWFVETVGTTGMLWIGIEDPVIGSI